MKNGHIFTLTDDAEIQFMLPEHLAERAGGSFDQTDVNVGMEFAEGNDLPGKDLVIDRVGCADGDGTGFQTADAVRGLLKLLLDPQQIADER